MFVVGAGAAVCNLLVFYIDLSRVVRPCIGTCICMILIVRSGFKMVRSNLPVLLVLLCPGGLVMDHCDYYVKQGVSLEMATLDMRCHPVLGLSRTGLYVCINGPFFFFFG